MHADVLPSILSSERLPAQRASGTASEWPRKNAIEIVRGAELPCREKPVSQRRSPTRFDKSISLIESVATAEIRYGATMVQRLITQPRVSREFQFSLKFRRVCRWRPRGSLTKVCRHPRQRSNRNVFDSVSSRGSSPVISICSMTAATSLR